MDFIVRLQDSKGTSTSHLVLLFISSTQVGLLYRSIHYLELGTKPIFVFDGQAPPEKFNEVTPLEFI